MVIRGLIMATATLAVSMCATQAAQPAADVTTGPDGLVLRNAPTDDVEANALPAPEAADAGSDGA